MFFTLDFRVEGGYHGVEHVDTGEELHTEAIQKNRRSRSRLSYFEPYRLGISYDPWTPTKARHLIAACISLRGEIQREIEREIERTGNQGTTEAMKTEAPIQHVQKHNQGTPRGHGQGKNSATRGERQESVRSLVGRALPERPLSGAKWDAAATISILCSSRAVAVVVSVVEDVRLTALDPAASRL